MIDEKDSQNATPGDACGEPLLRSEIERLRGGETLSLLLDYDGTLVPFAAAPDLAIPDRELVTLLYRLSRRPRTCLHILSGGPRRTLDRWFGRFPIALHAEHGYWSRPITRGAWIATGLGGLEWKRDVLEGLMELTRRTLGSCVEAKTSSIAWHYRSVDRALAETRINEIRTRFGAEGEGYELVAGAKVLEFRKAGINKGRIAALAATHAYDVLAAGDDSTDEELFEALPFHAVSIHVGGGPTRAGHLLPTPRALREILSALLEPRCSPSGP